MKSIKVAAILCGLLMLQSCGGGESEGSASGMARLAKDESAQVSRLIVKIQSSGPQNQAELLSNEMRQMLSQRAGYPLSPVRIGGLGAHVLELPQVLSLADAQAVAARIHSLPGVVYAEPDVREKISVIPNDISFNRQWALAEPEKVAGGINAVGAWDITQGAATVIVAVVDTGVLPHSELAGRLLPGYDFVSDSLHGNDGDGRDANASDPGDWILASEANSYGETTATPSSWHGTHVAGIVAAAGNNVAGVAGIAWNTRILPVRVLGKGGGYSSDIADGIIWAAGGAVPGVPMNPNPAKVINLSFGGTGACTYTYQNAINLARSLGAIVVAAAGNEAQSASTSRPANCPNVISVAATSNAGALAAYSNYGSGVTVSAPGGDSGSAMVSLGDGGSLSPMGDNGLKFAMGTSMSAPVVSGVAALMLAVNPTMTPDQVKSTLTFSASRFPTGTARDCTVLICGAGIVNALSAVRAASAGSVGASLPAPQSGWWWNEQEGGRGYAIEIRNGNVFMAGFLYEATGAATWFVSTGAMTDATHYQGSMSRYSGGQTLTGSFKAATQSANLGQVKLAFSGATRATITWPDGQSTPIQRFDIVTASTTLKQNGFTPEAGWWWNHAEPGRGFAIEVQGDNLFVAGFMYDDAGAPVWHVSTGTMTSPTYYTGRWVSYANGQAISQPFKPPTLTNANAGAISIIFSDTRNATLQMPNGQQIAIQRFMDYGVATPITADPISLTLANKMLGNWVFNYTISNTYTDSYAFTSTWESEALPGMYFALGLNQYDDTTLVGYDEESASYFMLSQHPDWATFDSFHTFTLGAGGQTLVGCYYLYYRTGDLSPCYALTGMKTANSDARGLASGNRPTVAAMQIRMAQVAQEDASASTKKLLNFRRTAVSQQQRLLQLARTLR